MVGTKEKGECPIPLVINPKWGVRGELTDAELEF